MRYDLSEISAIIKDRRTIYPEHYSPRKVQREIVENILNNAIWAPTHGKTQPWRFKVFMEGGLPKLGKFLQATYAKYNKGEDFKNAKYDRILKRTQQSSVIIAVCMDRTVDTGIPEIEEVEAVACAIQNMALTCTAYGLGCFWSSSSLINTEDVLQFLGLEKKDKVLSLFYIGYTDEPWPKSHRKPIEYVTEWID